MSDLPHSYENTQHAHPPESHGYAPPSHVPPTGSASSYQTGEVLPDFALKYAPLVYLHSEDKFFPGIPSEHIKHVIPRKFMTGEEITIPAEHRDKLSMLTLPEVNKPDVFLTLDKDIRTDAHIDELCSPHCKPDKNGKSLSPVWIIVRDKTGVCPGEGKIEDVFYFFFYPYNEGNSVLFKHFGNHVGDWEHAMVRFRNGKPECMHLSAHSDGNAWNWDLFEKQGDRPIIYSAGGSHAMYPKSGTHNYSGVFLVGPKDHTSKGFLWDPTLNFVVARSHGQSDEPASKYTYVLSTAPGFNKDWKPEDVVATLTFKGRWGNSFSDLRFRQPKKPGSDSTDQGHGHGGITSLVRKVKNTVLHDDKKGDSDEDSGDELHKAEAAAVKGEAPQAIQELQKKGIGALSIKEKLLILIWAEGPTGPRDKSLERATVNRWKAELCTAL